MVIMHPSGTSADPSTRRRRRNRRERKEMMPLQNEIGAEENASGQLLAHMDSQVQNTLLPIGKD